MTRHRQSRVGAAPSVAFAVLVVAALFLAAVVVGLLADRPAPLPGPPPIQIDELSPPQSPPSPPVASAGRRGEPDASAGPEFRVGLSAGYVEPSWKRWSARPGTPDCDEETPPDTSPPCSKDPGSARCDGDSGQQENGKKKWDAPDKDKGKGEQQHDKDDKRGDKDRDKSDKDNRKEKRDKGDENKGKKRDKDKCQDKRDKGKGKRCGPRGVGWDNDY